MGRPEAVLAFALAALALEAAGFLLWSVPLTATGTVAALFAVALKRAT